MKKEFTKTHDHTGQQLRNIIVLLADSLSLERKAAEAQNIEEREDHLESAMSKIESAISIARQDLSVRELLRRDVSLGEMNKRLDHLHRLHQESRHLFDNKGITERQIAAKNSLALS